MFCFFGVVVMFCNMGLINWLKSCFVGMYLITMAMFKPSILIYVICE